MPPANPYALGRFRSGGGGPFSGVVVDERVLPLGDIYADAPDVTALLGDWPVHSKSLDAAVAAALEGWAARATAVADLEVLAPIMPTQIFQSGANYKTHVVQLMVAAAAATISCTTWVL